MARKPRQATTVADATPGIGDNSGGGIVRGSELLNFIQDMEGLEEQRASLLDDKKAIRAEAKARGYSLKTIDIILKRRKRKRDEIEEERALVELYEDAIAEASDV